jgi:hypothetical protein
LLTRELPAKDEHERRPFAYFIAVKNTKGEIVTSFHDENGNLFSTEQEALARVRDVEREYPDFNVRIEKTYIVNLDAGPEDVESGGVRHVEQCPTSLPDDLVAPIRLAAERWHKSLLRPRVAPEVLVLWSKLIDEWITDSTAPLLVRKSAGPRGKAIPHRTGRIIVPVDNTPAHWALGLALTGKCPSLEDVHTLLNRDALPIAMALKASERAQAKYTGATAKWLGLLNRYGWKVCHIANVGLKTPAPLHVIDIRGLSTLFRALIDPSNMFLVPLKWAGFAELPEVVARFSATSRA